VKKFAVRSFTATKLLLVAVAAVLEAVLLVLELTHLPINLFIPFKAVGTLSTLIPVANSIFHNLIESRIQFLSLKIGTGWLRRVGVFARGLCTGVCEITNIPRRLKAVMMGLRFTGLVRETGFFTHFTKPDVTREQSK